MTMNPEETGQPPVSFVRRRLIAAFVIVGVVVLFAGVGGVRYAMFRFESRAMLGKAMAHLDAGEYEAAAQQLQRYIPRRPSNIQAMYWLARAKVAGPDPSREAQLEAVSALQSLLADEPGHVEGQYLLLQCLRSLGEGEAAGDLARRMSVAMPHDPLVLRSVFAADLLRGDTEAVLARTETLRHAMLSPEAGRIVNDASLQAHLQRHEPTEAVMAAEQIIRDDPADRDAFRWFLRIGEANMEPAHLLRSIERHAQRQDDDLDRRLVLASGWSAWITAVTREDSAQGTAVPDQRARLSDMLDGLMAERSLTAGQSVLLTDALAGAGRHSEVFTMLRRACVGRPSDIDAWVQVLLERGAAGRSLLALAAIEAEEEPAVLAALCHATARQDGSAVGVGLATRMAMSCERAWNGQERGDHPDDAGMDAEADAAKALRAGRSLLLPWVEGSTEPNVGALAVAGKLSQRLHRLDEAEGLYRRALQIQPQSPSLLNNLAMVLAEQGIELDEARRLAAAAQDQLGDHPAVLDTIARIAALQHIAARGQDTVRLDTVQQDEVVQH